MPMSEDETGITVVMSKVFDQSGLDELRLATGFEFHPVLAPLGEIERFAKKYLGVGAGVVNVRPPPPPPIMPNQTFTFGLVRLGGNSAPPSN